MDNHEMDTQPILMMIGRDFGNFDPTDVGYKRENYYKFGDIRKGTVWICLFFFLVKVQHAMAKILLPYDANSMYNMTFPSKIFMKVVFQDTEYVK